MEQGEPTAGVTPPVPQLRSPAVPGPLEPPPARPLATGMGRTASCALHPDAPILATSAHARAHAVLDLPPPPPAPRVVISRAQCDAFIARHARTCAADRPRVHTLCEDVSGFERTLRQSVASSRPRLGAQSSGMPSARGQRDGRLSRSAPPPPQAPQPQAPQPQAPPPQAPPPQALHRRATQLPSARVPSNPSATSHAARKSRRSRQLAASAASGPSLPRGRHAAHGNPSLPSRGAVVYDEDDEDDEPPQLATPLALAAERMRELRGGATAALHDDDDDDYFGSAETGFRQRYRRTMRPTARA